MATKTIAQTIENEMTAKGYTLIGKTSGQYSTKPNSNLGRKLAQLGVTADEVVIRYGAKKHYKTEGTDLLIFRK